jgi:uncharacterized protein YukE
VTDLGIYDRDVEFAWGEASRLKHEFERAADELEGQLGSRRSQADHAERDWHGRYRSVFENIHMSCTIGDARGIVAELRRCAQMLEQLANLAREENDRRRQARAWKVKHDDWKRAKDHQGILGDIGDFLGGDDEPKPPNIPVVTPQPFVASEPPSNDRG